MMMIPNTVAVMRLYGVNASGNSVLAHVHGYRPYFYVKAPPGFDPSVCEEFRNLLNIALNRRVPSFSNDKERKRKRKEEEEVYHDDDYNDGQLSNRFSSPELETYVLSVEPCKKQTIWNYQTEENCDFLKIYFALPQHMSVARRILESGINFPRIGPCTFLTFESDVSYVMRYMVDSGIVGASWITICSFMLRSENKKTSNCQVNFIFVVVSSKEKKTN
jgi:DNA polymerase delta subunit 1